MNSRKRIVWQKRIAIILVLIILLILAFQTVPSMVSISEVESEEPDYYATSSEAKKIISLVYDDSASMSDGGNVNWAYANYAFQTFVSLLNDNDELYVTYMSNPTQSVLLASPDITRQGSIDDVHDHFNNKATSVTSVTTAFNRLDEMEATADSVEYWLVVLTDGYLQASGTTEALSEEYIDEMVDDYANTTLQNGSRLNVVYLAIGDDVAHLSEETEEDAVVKYAADGNDIVTCMSEIAKEIERWDEPEDGAISDNAISNNRIEVTTEYPLERITVLCQGVDTEIVSFAEAEADDRSNLTIHESLEIIYPEFPGCRTNEDLNATVGSLTGGKSFIEPGTYVITFSKAITGADIDLMYNVAAETRLYIYNETDSEYVKDAYGFFDSASYSMHTETVVTGTDNDFATYVGANESQKEDDIKVTDTNGYTSSSHSYERDASVYSEGNNYIETYSRIRYVEREISVNMKVQHTDVYVTKIEGSRNTVKRNEIMDRTLSMQVQVYHDDEMYTRRELEQMRVEVSTSQSNIEVETNISNDGTITVTPYYGRPDRWFKFIAGWTTSWRVEVGTYKVLLSFYNSDGQVGFVCNQAYNIEAEPLWLNIFNHALPFIVIIFLWGYTKKPWFSRNMQINYMPVKVRDGMYVGDKENWVLWLIRPRLFDFIPVFISFRDIIPYLADKRSNKQISVTAQEEDVNLIEIRTKRDCSICEIIIREDTISRNRDFECHLDSDRLTHVDSDVLRCDESVAFIVRNNRRNTFMLYLVTFNRKRKNDSRDRR